MRGVHDMDKPIRVLHVLGGLDAGGAESFIMNIYRSIDKSQIQFDFIKHLSSEGIFEDEIRSLGGRIYICLPFNGKNYFTYCKWWQEFFSQHPEYHVIHSHVRSTASIYLPIAKKHGLTTIVHSHSTSNGSGITAIVKNLLQLSLRKIADYLFSCSDIAGSWLFGKRALDRPNYRMIPNSIDLERFTFNEQIRRDVRQRLGLQENDLVIGHIGRFSEPKNHPFLIRVFQEIRKKNKRAQLLLIGGGQKQAEIEELVSQQGLSACVHFLGIQKRPELFYQAMDVFLFPSLWEGLPVGVVEAQASGLPCVVSDVITKQVCLTDLVFSVSLRSSAEEWADVVLRCVRPQRCGLNAGQRLALSGFDSRTVAAELTKFYLEIGKHE